jgi:hypothetical protein
MSVEALHIVEFGDVAGSGLRNGGVVVLETGRVFGGDSGYYYLGEYSVDGSKITADIAVVKHNPAWSNAFGDTAQRFKAHIVGRISGNVIQGHMERVDIPGTSLSVKLTHREDLP